ncbi:hypothetical protein HJFPF1_12510 [Paramyrothecium foliicola]|nr:hypothetical protein HJFPF1_12510 [Paramyrothecium foliicola]
MVLREINKINSMSRIDLHHLLPQGMVAAERFADRVSSHRPGVSASLLVFRARTMFTERGEWVPPKRPDIEAAVYMRLFVTRSGPREPSQSPANQGSWWIICQDLSVVSAEPGGQPLP